MRYILSILSIILFTSCNNRDEKKIFQERIATFDKQIINHFPKNTCGEYTFSIFNDNVNDVVSIILKDEYEDNILFNKIRDSLLTISKVKYNPNDSCLLVVNMYSNEKNYFNSFKTKDESYLKKECLKDKLPIANFWSLDLNNNNITNLTDNYNIYVFEAKNEIINKKYISKNVYMPSYWKHGYSKGVAMNIESNEIIYWFVLW